MERYDSYKDSGVEWIGEIPDDWDCRPISTLYDSRNEKVSEKDFPALSVTMQGIVPQLETAAKSNDTENRKLVKKGDFAINSRSDRRGSCGISDYDGSVSLITNVLKPKNTFGMENRYYSYLFSSEHFSDEYYRNGTGIVDDLWSTNWSRMKRIYVPVPSYSFQVKIAKYLDEKTSQIDSLIEKNEKSIELLEEYRKSIISEAVTKGLDPNAPMKDSGVEWIGEIPEGWVTRRLKNFLDNVPHSIVDGPFGSDLKSDEYTDTGVPVTQLNNIKEGFHRVDSFKFVSESKATQLSSHFVFPGDLLMAKMMPAGRTCIASSAYPKYLLSSDSIRIVIDSSVDRRFVCYAANCYCLAECELKSSGVTRIRINLSIVRNLSFVLPSLQEQKKIADYLDQKTAEIDSLISKKKQLIEKLAQYRKSLISECVTGKIKVPGVE